MKRGMTVSIVAALVVAACSEDPTEQLAAATPATGPALVKYSENPTTPINLGTNADLVQRFCKNQTGQACPADIKEKLAAAGFSGGGSPVELAGAFTAMEADRLDAAADGASSEETYMQAIYKTILARKPDAEGALVNLQFLKSSGERKQLVRSMLMSSEFKTLP